MIWGPFSAYPVILYLLSAALGAGAPRHQIDRICAPRLMSVAMPAAVQSGGSARASLELDESQ